jgi:malonyl-ACP O-methyltransferase BioC
MLLEDTHSLSNYFSRSASQYHRHAEFQRKIAKILAERYLAEVDPQSILELGCGTGFLTRQLIDRFPNAPIDAVDVSGEMIRLAQSELPSPRVRWHVADMNKFQSDRAYDLIASSTALHWGNPVDALIRRVGDHLCPGGKLVAAVMSAGTLGELHQLRQEVVPHKAPPRGLPSKNVLADCLSDANLMVRAITSETYRLTFSSPKEFFRSLRRTCFTGGPFSPSSTDVLVRSELDALLRLYQERFASACGGVYATFQVTFFVAEAPTLVAEA